MSMNKIADVQLETTAEYQDLSKLNVKFWNQDKNTAILKFNITRNNYPLSLSEENVKVFIALESGDSYLVDDDLDYLDELNGVVSYTIPNDFMRVATNVLGQVYVTTLDEEEVIVQRQFSFSVANDLIAELPSEEKIKEFKYFSDMREEVAKMLTKLNNDFENMNDYVSQVDQKTKDGINELNSLISQKEQAYNDNHTKKMKEITDKGNQYTNDFTTQREYIDTKYADFQNAVQGSGLVTTSQSSNWQKYKFTNDDGTRKYLAKGSFTDVTALPPGFYETPTTQNPTGQGFPPGIGSEYTVLIDVTRGTSGKKQIKVIQSIDGKTFVKYVHTEGSVVGWKEIVYQDSNNPFETTTGSQAKANIAESNAKTYASELVGKKTTLLFEGTANGVGTTINLSETLDNFVALIIFVSFPGGLVTVLGNPYGTDTIPLQLANILDTSGNGGGIYEAILTKNTRTQLSITNDVYFDLVKLEGSGANANKITIKRIVGVRK